MSNDINSDDTLPIEYPGEGKDDGPVEDALRLPALRTRMPLSVASRRSVSRRSSKLCSPKLACRATCSTLRDEIEATLLAASGQIEALSDAPSTGGIVGVGIGLGDPDSVTFGAAGPGPPTLTLFTESTLPQEALMSQVAQSAGTRALASVPTQQVPVGTVDAYSHRARHRPAPAGVSLEHVKITAGTLGSRAIGLTSPGQSPPDTHTTMCWRTRTPAG